MLSIFNIICLCFVVAVYSISTTSFLTHGYSVGVFVSHRYHSISISAFFCVLIASSLLCAPSGNRLDQSRGFFSGTCPTGLYLGFIVYLFKFAL